MQPIRWATEDDRPWMVETARRWERTKLFRHQDAEESALIACGNDGARLGFCSILAGRRNLFVLALVLAPEVKGTLVAGRVLLAFLGALKKLRKDLDARVLFTLDAEEEIVLNEIAGVTPVRKVNSERLFVVLEDSVHG